MKLLVLAIFSTFLGWTQGVGAASCEEERAEWIKWLQEQSCGYNQGCESGQGWKTCHEYGPLVVTRYDAVYDKASCAYSWTYDTWDAVNVPPSFPPTHQSGSDDVYVLIPACVKDPLQQPQQPPSGGGSGGSGESGGPPSSCSVSGSVVAVETQMLTEEVEIVGTSSMVYHSGFQKGYSSNFEIRFLVSGVVPRDYIQSFGIQTKRNNLVVDTATYLNTIPNQTYTYTWDGLNAAGTASVISAEFQFRVNETSPSGTYPNDYTIVLSHWNAKDLGLGGWLPAPLKRYDPLAKRLYSASGGFVPAQARPFGVAQYYVPDSSGRFVYIFDLDGRHLETRTGLLGGVVYSFAYDSTGQLVSLSEPFGRVTTFNRNLAGELISITAPNGQNTIIELDTNGYISSIISPDHDAYEMSYFGSKGLMQSFERPNGELSTFEYDTHGLITKDSHSGGYFFELIRNLNSSHTFDLAVTTSMGRVMQVQTTTSIDGSIARAANSASGTTETVLYTPYGGVFNRVDSKFGSSRSVVSVDDQRFGATVRFPQSEVVSYYGGGSRSIDKTQSIALSDPADPFSISTWQVIAQLSGANTQVTTVFNPTTKKFTATTYLGKVTEWGIDSYERLVSTKQGTLNQTTYSYTNENLTSIVQGTRITNFGYNSLGLLDTVTNPLSQATSYVYNSANRMTSKILPDSRVVGFAYDGVGNITSVTPPGRPAHIFSLNGHGLMGGYEPPIVSGVSVVNTTYSYNLDKQLTAIVRPDGGFINYNYNATTGVLESVETPAGFYYHSLDATVGLPNYISDPFGNSIQIGYVGRSPASYSVSSSSGSFGYSAVYGTANRRESDSVTGPLGATSVISYVYNDDEGLRKAGDVNLTYNVPNGQLTGTMMGSGTTGFTDAYTYNNYGEVISYQAKRGTTVIYDLTLSRDAMGRIDGKTQVMDSVTDNYVYTFDSTGRLIQTNKNSVIVATYSYDSNSNRNGGTIGVQPTIATCDDQDRLLTYNTLSFSYNANGDLLAKTNSATNTTTQYVYDVFGNLTQVTLPSGAVITYEIDALNRRTGKLVNGVVQKRWIYMDQYRIAAELNAAGSIIKRFVYGSKGNIPDYMIASGAKYRIISDHLGSPRLVVKQSDGAVVQKMDHDEYGRVIADTNPGYLPFGFAGGLYDHQTGLVRFGAREYDAETGRWTSKDPILFNGNMTNLYGYAFHDPVNFIDPDGKNPLALIIAGPAVVGAVSMGVTTYLMTNSFSQAGEAFVTGGIAGASAGAMALGAVIAGAPSLAAGILAAGVDIGITIANAPGGLPNGGIADFASGVGRIMNPQDPAKNLCK